mgnify:CR=1 FL=1
MNNQVKECFHDWIENLQKVRNLSDNTLISYKNDIEKFLIFSKDHFGGNLSISDLDRMQISDFRSFLSFLRNRGIGTASIARVISSLKSCKILSSKKIKTNVTLCFSAAQALIAAKCGATYISPFVGRLDDIGENGMNLIREIKAIYSNYKNIKTKILVASVRTVDHVIESGMIGADVVTLPPATLEKLYKHPLTDKGLKAFLDDWKKTNQKIL